jgi:hypothetical protein
MSEELNAGKFADKILHEVELAKGSISVFLSKLYKMGKNELKNYIK